MADQDLAFAGLAGQAEAVRAGEVSPSELVQLHLERIERLEPQLNAFRVVRAERALAEAAEAEKRPPADGEAPLYGVPIAVKDSHDVAGELTTYGTGCVDVPAAEDCEMVKRLRAAGAIVIGKTNLPELAFAMFTESPTWGVTRNPWNTERVPGGSSGGSGAAVAAGLAAAATASDGAGSIRYPAAYCSLFGLKPQRGRVPLDPNLEEWHGMSVNGCLTRGVLDTALFLDVTAGGGLAPEKPPPPERSFVEAARTSPGKLRVAVSVKGTRALAPPMLDERCRRAVEQTAQLLASLGHEVSWRDPKWGTVGNGVSILYSRGVADDARGLPNRERLGRQVRGVARLGSLVPDSVLRRARAATSEAREADLSDLRGPRRPVASGGRRAAGAGGEVELAGRAVDARGDDQKDRLRPTLELPRQPGSRGSRRVHRRRPAPVRAARRAPERRGDPAVARRAAGV